MSEPITIVVNGEERQLPLGSDLAALLDMLDIPGQHIAIELNGELRERDLATVLEAGDRIEIVRFVGGG